MKSSVLYSQILGTVVVAALMMPSVGIAEEAASKAATAAPTTQKTTRELIEELNTTSGELSQLLGGADEILDPAKRAQTGPKVIPVLKRFVALVTELAHTEPKFAPRADQFRIRTLAMLSAFGDAPTDAQLKQAAGGADKGEALTAKASLLLADWWRTSKDAAAQEKVVDGLKALATENPEDDRVTFAAMQMIENGTASPALETKVERVVIDDLKGPGAQQVGAQLESMAKLKGMENKPLVIAGPTIDGKPFSTADWKGKVILVDFWATWCGPCLGELPRVKKAYADFHGKGLEVLGVSCDQEAEALRTFLMQNPDMPWPQLFNVNKPGWHELATSYGIHGIPTMFLIDKKGMLRSVTARENFEQMIPKLLEEKAE